MRKHLELSGKENDKNNMHRLRKKGEDTITSKEVATWVKEQYKKCGLVQPWTEWQKDLFTKPYQDTIEWILDRYNNAENELEYYHCMIYMYKTLPDNQLFVPWKERQKTNMPKSFVVRTTSAPVRITQYSNKVKISSTKTTKGAKCRKPKKVN